MAILPDRGSNRPATRAARVDLPAPDSPTSTVV